MATGLEKRKQLFNKFSNQLLLLKHNGIIDTTFKYARPFLCPICLIEFTETDLQDNSSNFLTLEDAPPDSLGGSKIALTCKKCNSECGHNIDNHLTEVLRGIDASFFYKGSKRFGTITHEGKKITVELTSQGDGTLTAYHRIKQNNPTLLDKFIYGIKNKTIGPILNIDPPKVKFDSKRVNYAILKAHYIITFSKFGYIFLLNKEYDGIRQQLLNPAKEIFPWTPFIKDQFTSDKVGTYYVHNKGAESIFNIFSLKTEYSETLIGGLLPVPTISISEFVKNIDNQKNHKKVVTLDTTKYDPNADLFTDMVEINKIVRWLGRTKTAANN
jgi:hypothetical protein